MNDYQSIGVPSAFAAGNLGSNYAFTFYSTSTGATVLGTFRNPNGTVGTIGTSGSSTSFNTSSDERLKQDLRPFDAGKIIDALNPGEFNWRKDGVMGYGVYAQEAVKAFPQAVTTGSDERDKDGELVRPWQVDYSKFVPVLLEEAKADRARIAALESGLQAERERRASTQPISMLGAALVGVVFAFGASSLRRKES